MATISSALRTLLAGDSGVTAVLSSTTAIYPHPFPANPDFPLLAYREVAGSDVLRSAPAGTSESRADFQLDTFAYSYAEGQNMKAALKALLDGYEGSVSGIQILKVDRLTEFDMYDEETKLYRYGAVYAIYHDGA